MHIRHCFYILHSNILRMILDAAPHLLEILEGSPRRSSPYESPCACVASWSNTNRGDGIDKLVSKELETYLNEVS